ncbi:multi-component regulatory system-3 [Alloactinosynnema sp. L-07]|nr:multi-component regulatory system-3 [Alloactinosynnema sp. L-07]
MTMTGMDEDPEGDPDLFGVRPYAMTDGRTQPSTHLDLMSLVRATGGGMVAPDKLGVEHAQALRLCQSPTSVAEVAAHLRRPVTVAKVLLADLIELGVVIARFPPNQSYSDDPAVLRAVIDGLRRIV